MTTDSFQRKLAAILSADVVGYSRLMGDDEAATVKTLETYKGVMFSLIKQHRGRVVDSPGDNLLAEFGSVVDAVQCAVEIHEVIRAKNEELPDDRRMLFRIGVNLGDVIEEGDRIYGDGVNIAARLEGLAEAGGICISGSAHEQIENKLALGYEFLGKHTVKNIAKPVKVYRVPVGPKADTSKKLDEKKPTLKKWRWTALGAAGATIVIVGALVIWNFSFRQVPEISDVKEAPKTIAVLPFVNLSPDPDQEYFVDGLSEELLNSLTKIPDLLVTARTSSFAFKGTSKNVQEIANELGVAHILEGSVRKAGNALRITAQLIRAADGFHLWSETYDRELKDIFAVQEDIATSVANELKLTLGIDKPLKDLGGTNSAEAYEFYLIATGQFLNFDYSAALESLEAATDIDPNFVSAWAFKGLIHSLTGAFSPADRISLELDIALEMAQKATELEPNYGWAYEIIGSIYSAKGKFIEAELAFQKVERLSLASIPHYWSLGYFKKCGEILERIRREDPLNPMTLGAYILNLGYLGDMEEAEKEYNRGKTIFGDPWSYGDFNIVWVRFGDKEARSINDIPNYLKDTPVFGMVAKQMESPKEGLKELHRLYNSDENQAGSIYRDIAFWAAYFGDPDFALDAMEKTFNLHTINFYFIWSPSMKTVRQLPRFKEFIREKEFVVYWNKFGWPDVCRPVGNDDFVCD